MANVDDVVVGIEVADTDAGASTRTKDASSDVGADIEYCPLVNA
jgi:hypothetical protein